MRKPLLAAFAAAALASTPALADQVQAGRSFRVVCQIGHEHGSDPDRVEPEREVRLLREAIADTYPHLSPELRAVADRLTYMVNHQWTKITKTYMGWSAEDDPEYKYPDTGFHGEGGTIKANFTEKFIRVLDAGEELGRENPAAAAGARVFARMVISHELMHAWQYHTGPVKDLNSEGAVKDGLPDPRVLEETKRKVEYEHQAFTLDRALGAGHEDELYALARAIAADAKAHPELYAEGGARRLLVSEPNSVLTHYLGEEVKAIAFGGEFTPNAKLTYEGQYVVPQLVVELKRLNDMLELAHSLSGAAEAPQGIGALEDTWKRYMEAGAMSEQIKKNNPYLVDVEKRYRLERERYRLLTGR